MLEQWLEAAVQEAGAEVDASLLGESAVTVILDLARHAAHNVERPAAPLAAFAAGLAVGQSGAGFDGLEDIAARIGGRARAWADES